MAVAPWVEVEQKLACYEGISPAPNGASPSVGHISPSRSSTAASSQEHKLQHFSKSLYFAGQSSSNLPQPQTLALWEAAVQPSGLWSGKLGYGSPNPLAGATEMRAQGSDSCCTPQQRSPRPGETLDVAV